MFRYYFKATRLSLLIFLLFPVAITLAQSATATLSGAVVDQTGAVVPGAEITLINTATGLLRRATTNEYGYFIVPLLPPGAYTVRAQREKFAPVEISNVVLNVHDQRAIQIQLKVGVIGDTVNVVNEAPLIDESPAVATVVDRQFLENLPLNGKSFQSLISLTPGVALTNAGSGQFSVNGQRSNANYFTVDGVSANIGITTGPGGSILGNTASGSLPGLTTFGGTNGLVSVDALQEFKIQTSSYSSEFGRSPGGQVSLVTRSGTNEFRGALFEYFRNEALDANDWFTNRASAPKAPLRQNQFGGVAGGPIFLPRFGEGAPYSYDGRNRTFFFFSYEGLRLRLPQFIISDVPSLRLRQEAGSPVRPLLDSFPIPTGPEFLDARSRPTGAAPFSAAYSDLVSLDAAGVRVDHTVNKKLAVFARYNYAPSRNESRERSNISNAISDIRTLTMGGTLSASPLLSNEIRVNYSRAQGQEYNILDDFGGAIPVPDSLLFPPFASPERNLVQIGLSFASIDGYARGTGATNGFVAGI